MHEYAGLTDTLSSFAISTLFELTSSMAVRTLSTVLPTSVNFPPYSRQPVKYFLKEFTVLRFVSLFTFLQSLIW